MGKGLLDRTGNAPQRARSGDFRSSCFPLRRTSFTRPGLRSQLVPGASPCAFRPPWRRPAAAAPGFVCPARRERQLDPVCDSEAVRHPPPPCRIRGGRRRILTSNPRRHRGWSLHLGTGRSLSTNSTTARPKRRIAEPAEARTAACAQAHAANTPNGIPAQSPLLRHHKAIPMQPDTCIARSMLRRCSTAAPMLLTLVGLSGSATARRTPGSRGSAACA